MKLDDGRIVEKRVKRMLAKRLEPEGDGLERVQISTGVLDRELDRVIPGGMRAEAYLNNPVVMWAHDYRLPPIGKTETLEQGELGPVAGFRFLPGDDFADRVSNAWKQGFINAASIGFMPLDWEPNEEGGWDITSWELYEWSLVPIPANQEALRLAVKAAGLEGLFEGLNGAQALDKALGALAQISRNTHPLGLTVETVKGTPLPEISYPQRERIVIPLRTQDTGSPDTETVTAGLPEPSQGAHIEATTDADITQAMDILREPTEKLAETIKQKRGEINDGT